MRILGISAFYHDSAAALIRNGEIISAVQEERFTRIKHDSKFPTESIKYCLESDGCSLSEIDFIVFYEKPLLKLDRLIETYIAFAPLGFKSFKKAIPIWAKEKIFLPKLMRRELEGIEGEYKKPFVFTAHHESHAASAFFPSPFNESAIITADGVGEWTTSSISKGKSNKINILYEQRFPHSLGLLYSAFTYYCGFRVNSGEYKLMGLAPYGIPRFTKKIENELIEIKHDGSLKLNMSYFNYCQGLTMTNARFEKLFGNGVREPESEIKSFHLDIAASIQKVVEKVMLKIANHAYELTPSKNLCLAGGVALNCVSNGNLIRHSPFEKIWIQPASGDAGGAIGSALFVWHQLLGRDRVSSLEDMQKGTFLGPSYSNNFIVNVLNSNKLNFECIKSELDYCSKVAEYISQGKVIGWFQGKMEFGPRALGARSIIADPRDVDMQKKLNKKIKFRESFRPFAPSILKEQAYSFFPGLNQNDSNYMQLVAQIDDSQILEISEEYENLKWQERLEFHRSNLQAVTHVDFSARVQTVDRNINPLYHKLISSFNSLTGCPLVVNTSFNVRGQPIVQSPEEAIEVFFHTHMDVLAIGNFILEKEKQPKGIIQTWKSSKFKDTLD